MACNNCDCKECTEYKKKYCPECDHHLKYHRDGECTQPTCNCHKIPKVSWEDKA